MKFQLLNVKNAKTIKGEKKGFRTYILYLASHTNNDYGKNLCPMATKGCSKGCLVTAGFGRFESVVKGRIKKSNWFISNRKTFLERLVMEIEMAITDAKENNLIPVFRLNGTSDIQWENIKIYHNKNVFELFPDIIFYDYTKIVNRFNKTLPANYNLTFSYSAEEDYYSGRINGITESLLKMGINVSVVFRNKLPKTFLGFPVVDGDVDDLRFTNNKGVIIGLHAKGKAKKDTTGFVID